MLIKTPKGNDAEVIYSNIGIPTDGIFLLYQGYTVDAHVTIQPHLEDDAGLLAHELTHVDQYYEYYLFGSRYKWWRSFRFSMESEAFAAQLFVNGNAFELKNYACELSTKYDIRKSNKVCADSIYKQYKRMVKNV